jgi:hypothetical protein
MTWNPPPEKDRPDGYTCLGYSSPWNGYPSFWTACIWHKESQSWFSVEDWKMEPNTFAPLPEVATARIAELEAELAMALDAISATPAQKRKRIMTNFDFKWLLPVVGPFAVYGYLRLFFAVPGIIVEPEFDVALACISVVVGLLGGVFAAGELASEGVKWRWLARKDKPND